MKNFCYIFFFSAVLLVALPSFADTVTVCDSGCSTTSIQTGVDMADPGDTVQLQDDFTITAPIDVNKKVTLTSDNNTINSSSDLAYLLLINADNIIIQNIIFEKGSGNTPIGIEFSNSEIFYGVQIKNNEFNDFTTAGIALFYDGDESSTKQIKIENNTFDNNALAILVDGGGGSDLSRNILINSNTIAGAASSNGIELLGNTIDVQIKNNVIEDVDTGIIFNSSYDFYVGGSPYYYWFQNEAESNTIRNCTTGISVISNEIPLLKSNTIENNDSGIIITSGAPQLSSSNTIQSNTTGISINASNVVINDVDLFENDTGLEILGGDRIQVSNSNIADNNEIGIDIAGGTNHWIVNNTITNNQTNNLLIAADASLEKNSIGGADAATSILVNAGTVMISGNGISGDNRALEIAGGDVTVQLNKIAEVGNECMYLTGGTLSRMGGYGYSNQIYNCGIGLRVTGGNIGGDGVTYNTFRNNEVGLQIEHGSFTYDSNYIYDNEDGLYVLAGASATFRYNHVTGNDNIGIILSNGSAAIENNIINDNTKLGVDIKSSGSTLVGNQIYNNGQEGIEVSSGISADFSNNIIHSNNEDDDQVTDAGNGTWNNNYFETIADYDVNNSRLGDGIADSATVTIPGAGSDDDDDPLITSAYIDTSEVHGVKPNKFNVPIIVPDIVKPVPIGSTRKAYLWYSYSQNGGTSWSEYTKYGTSLDIDKYNPNLTPAIPFTAPVTTPTPNATYVIYRFFVQGYDETLNNKEVVPAKATVETTVYINAAQTATYTPSFTITPSFTPTETNTKTPTRTVTPTGTYYSPTNTYTFTPTFTKTPINWELTATRTPVDSFINPLSNVPNPPTGGGSSHGGGGGGGGSGSTSTPSNETVTPTATYSVGEDTVPDNTKALKNFYANEYKAEWVAQYQASEYESSSNDGDEYFDVSPCTVVDFWAELRNVGARAWISSNHAEATSRNEFTFATYKDPLVKSAPSWTGYDDCPLGSNCGKSYFWHSSWVSQYRIGTLDDTIVYPGDESRVSMTFQVPCSAESGRYREDISAASGWYWIYNDFNGDPLDVMHIWVGFDIS